jgi:N-acetylneuraminic acid mutarotase
MRQGFVCCAVALAACSGQAVPEDGRDDSFLGSGKADTGGIAEGTPEAIGVLKLANTASYEVLSDPGEVGLSQRAADNIIAYRIGDDGIGGTADDATFQTLAQLDAIPFIGPIAFQRLLKYAQSHGFVPVLPAAMPAPNFFGAAALGPDGRIYSMGGYDASFNITGVVNAYDPRTNTWSAVAAMPTPRVSFAATLGPDGRIYAIGGYAATGGYTGAVEAYDANSNSWSTVTSMATPRAYLGAAVAGDGRIYAVGGYVTSVMTTVEVYDIPTGTWVSGPDLTTPRYVHCVTAGKDGRVYAIGGYTGTGPGYLASVEAFDPNSKTWSAVASMPVGRIEFSAASGSDGQIYVAAGFRFDQGIASDLLAYDPSVNVWKPRAALSGLRYEMAMTGGADGRIYGLGGFNSTQMSLQLSIYDPAHDSWSDSK